MSTWVRGMVLMGVVIWFSACVDVHPFAGCRVDRDCSPGQMCDDGACVERIGLDLTCDGIDDDADGRLDEDAAESPEARTLVGVCLTTRLICEAGQWLEPIYAEIDGYQETETVCDGLDNDCDGVIDEGEGGCTFCVPGTPGQDGPPCNGCPETVAVPAGWVCLPPGVYDHGYADTCPPEGCNERFRVLREVELTRPFLMMATEVTQAQYREVMLENPSPQSNCPQCPVDGAPPERFFEYANRLSQAHGLTPCYTTLDQIWAWSDVDCDGYRLPTDVEWEYGARGKAPYGQFWWREVYDSQVMWMVQNAAVPRTSDRCRSGDEPPQDASEFAQRYCVVTHPVGGLLPNEWGLYDTAGNVWEVLFDSANAARWPETTRLDPVTGFGPEGRGHRGFMLGGGSVQNTVNWYADPGYRHVTCCGGDFVGFRLVRTVLPAP